MTTVFITTTGSSTWTVPAGVTSLQVECIGGGAGGYTQSVSDYGAGGGAGAYAKTNAVSVTPGQTVYLFVGTGGAANTAGADTWANKTANTAPASTTDGALAKGGAAATSTGTVGGAGGAAASCVGNTSSSGGSGGDCSSPSAIGGGGGGGAAGPSGAGKNGGSVPTGVTTGGGGGGGSNGGSSTAASNVTAGDFNGTAGGAGTGGTGGGAANGGAGSAGGGGGGGNGGLSPVAGGAGGSDTAFDATHGCGGGGGGGGGNPGGGADTGGNGGAAGSYGGGGGGGGFGDATAGTGGSGAQGLIAITYTAPATPAFSEFGIGGALATKLSAANFSDFELVPSFGPFGSAFDQWVGASRKIWPGSSFDEEQFYVQPSESPVYGGSFGEWWQVPYRPPQGLDFEQNRLTHPLPPLSFDEWPPAHKIVYLPVDFGLFAIRPEEVLSPDPTDSVRRPKHKIVRKSRFDYSIYNRPPFDVIHGEEDWEELTEDELDDIRLQVIDEMLAELGVAPEAREEVAEALEEETPDAVAIYVQLDDGEEILRALTEQKRAAQDAEDILSALFAPMTRTLGNSPTMANDVQALLTDNHYGSGADERSRTVSSEEIETLLLGNIL